MFVCVCVRMSMHLIESRKNGFFPQLNKFKDYIFCIKKSILFTLMNEYINYSKDLLFTDIKDWTFLCR